MPVTDADPSVAEPIIDLATPYITETRRMNDSAVPHSNGRTTVGHVDELVDGAISGGERWATATGDGNTVVSAIKAVGEQAYKIRRRLAPGELQAASVRVLQQRLG